MNLPEPLRSHLPNSLGYPTVLPAAVSRRSARLENALAADLRAHELALRCKEIKAGRERAANSQFVDQMTTDELGYYRKHLAEVGASEVAHALLADGLSLLVALNREVAREFARR